MNCNPLIKFKIKYEFVNIFQYYYYYFKIKNVMQTEMLYKYYERYVCSHKKLIREVHFLPRRENELTVPLNDDFK